MLINLYKSNIDTRYKDLKIKIEEHALIELGISLYYKNKKPEDGSYFYETYSIPLLPNFVHRVSPSSMSFLASHGFNFNELYGEAKGYDLIRSFDKNNYLHRLWKAILESKKVIALHCGMLDMMFIYHAFIGELPLDVNTFQQKVYQTFCLNDSIRIFDTKFIAETHFKEPKSNLNSLYEKAVKGSEDLVMPKYLQKAIQNAYKRSQKMSLQDNNIEEGSKLNEWKDLKKRKMFDSEELKSKHGLEESQLHGAGFDAYATGYVYAYFKSKMTDEELTALGNRLYLVGKASPLVIYQSSI